MSAKDFRAVWSDADDFVRGADVWLPYLIGSREMKLGANPFFLPAIVTSTVLVLFAIAGGWTLGNGSVFYGLLMCLIFAMVNIIQAVIAVSGDNGTGDWFELKRSDRSYASWAFLVLLLILNLFGAFIGSAVVGSNIATKQAITATTVRSDIQRQQELTAELAALRKRRLAAGSESPTRLAQEAERLEKDAIRESWRTRSGAVVDESRVERGEWGPKCGTRCAALKSDAARYRALAADAKREGTLQSQLKSLNARLQSRSGSVSTEGNPAGKRLEEWSAGWVQEEEFARNVMVVLQWVIAVVDFLLWLRVGDGVGRARAREYRSRAEMANASLENQGLEARYPINDPIKPAEAVAGEGGSSETVVLAIEHDPEAIIASSQELSDVDAFFKAVLVPDETRKVAFGTLYGIFAARKQAAGAKTWMGRSAFVANLKRYAELRKYDVLSSQFVGWRLAVQDENKTETQEAAE
ncbi:MAG: hypothetical protein AAGC70_01875 [Pseudomonadota bacterium]